MTASETSLLWRALQCLLEPNPEAKVQAIRQLCQAWQRDDRVVLAGL